MATGDPAADRRAGANMTRLEAVALALPEAERVDVEAWGDHPTFRVRGKNFVFCDDGATNLTVKLPHDEAAAVVATVPGAEPAGYGLGRHGWVNLPVTADADDDTWDEVAELVRTSYCLVAPKRLAREVAPDRP
jgi:predicted DNA-binding protein (MmcQ/YjbR family)